MLQDKLRISNKKLEEYETRFKCQEETTQKLMLEYQARLEESEERLRRQQEDKEIQMKGIISRYRAGGSAGDDSKAGSLAGVRADPCSGQSGFFGGAGRFPMWVFQHLFTSLPFRVTVPGGGFPELTLRVPHQCYLEQGKPRHFPDSQRQNFRRGELAACPSSRRIWQACFSVHMSNRCNDQNVLFRYLAKHHDPITPSYKSLSPTPCDVVVTFAQDVDCSVQLASPPPEPSPLSAFNQPSLTGQS